MTHRDIKPPNVPAGAPVCGWCGEPVGTVSLGVRMVGSSSDGKPRTTERIHACTTCWHRFDLGRTG